MCFAYSQTCGISFYSDYSGGGGGSGGSVSISACTITAGSSALVQANGGAGARSKYAISTFSMLNCGGGGGGGGVIVTKVRNNKISDISRNIYSVSLLSDNHLTCIFSFSSTSTIDPNVGHKQYWSFVASSCWWSPSNWW